jgi:hypothetical protein
MKILRRDLQLFFREELSKSSMKDEYPAFAIRVSDLDLTPAEQGPL